MREILCHIKYSVCVCVCMCDWVCVCAFIMRSARGLEECVTLVFERSARLQKIKSVFNEIMRGRGAI